MINKRYKDIFQQYIHKGEATPLSIGTLAVCALCFLILIIATFTQINFSHPWFKFVSHEGFVGFSNAVSYSPLLPAMIFIIYILGSAYSTLMFVCYLIVGFFIWPIFVFGGGIDYFQNYLFGYMLGFIFAIFFVSRILKISLNVRCRLFAAIGGVLAIHLCGFLYCIVLAIFKVISFSLVVPILTEISLGNIFYDILFSSLIILIAPYIKNVLWTCMKPKSDRTKKIKKYLHKTQGNQ